MKTITVLGARPQFIKAAPMSRAAANHGGVTDIIVHTGQHYDSNMSDVFFEELGIPAPKYHLGIGGGTHGQMTGRQLEAIEGVLLEEKPDVVLVYGDTNSTIAGALAASKLHIPVAHVEAGLRSFNRRMPEEVNRILTDHISQWCFAPTQRAVDLLAAEGISGDAVKLVGDVMYDAALIFGEKAEATSTILRDLSLAPGKFVLSTIHRQENTDDPARLGAILEALRTLSEDIPVVLPLHPRTRKILSQQGDLKDQTAGLILTDPLGFFDVTALTRASCLLMTDSGGMQKEGYFHRKPVVILRDETEWGELIDLGWARLVPPTSSVAILTAANQMRGTTGDLVAKPYGDGQAAKHILNALIDM
ncbi:non-hydrolyzing UDP-N-acetylglucosamine 2-epimerase [Pannonibacter phragmitetus]|uniref:non-hydrolyzing UDP-N-acetylglucosamine 2-epimerase n=1 Tax=Pannonibacter phragmitetus TaxID=121719 RepID=UPI003D2F0455